MSVLLLVYTYLTLFFLSIVACGSVKASTNNGKGEGNNTSVPYLIIVFIFKIQVFSIFVFIGVIHDLLFFSLSVSFPQMMTHGT